MALQAEFPARSGRRRTEVHTSWQGLFGTMIQATRTVAGGANP